jgi:excisionase family DNA binding protein
MASITTTEAAEFLGVSRHEARRLARAGDLLIVERVGQAILLDAASVHRAAAQSRGRGRPWDQHTAWAAVDLLNGGRAAWLSYAARSRLRARLATLSAEDFGALARRRAVTHAFRSTASYLSEIQQSLVTSGVADLQRTDADFGLAASGERVDGYTDATGLAEIIDAFDLAADTTGNVIVHEVHFTEALSVGSSAAMTALDLSDSVDVRERSAGLRVLELLLTPLRRQQ